MNASQSQIPGKKTTKVRFLLTSSFPLCFSMFEAGKFEVLIPVGIPGEGMLGSRFIPPVLRCHEC